MKKPKRSWKTTACGAITGVCLAFVSGDVYAPANKIVGFIAAAAAIVGGMCQRDNDVSSEDVKASKENKEA